MDLSAGKQYGDDGKRKQAVLNLIDKIRGICREGFGRLVKAICGIEDAGSDSGGYLYYIGSNTVLPMPLSEEEEEMCLYSFLQEGDEEARKRLIEHNLRLVVYLARKFENTGVGAEDLISIGTIGLIKAIGTYRTERKIKLATYASRCIENEILMYLRKNTKTRGEVSIEEPLNVDWDGNELLLSDILGTDDDITYRNLEQEADHKQLLKALSVLNKRDRVIVGMRYGLFRPGEEVMTQKEVAEKLGISQSYISRLEKKIIGRLKREMERA